MSCTFISMKIVYYCDMCYIKQFIKHVYTNTLVNEKNTIQLPLPTYGRLLIPLQQTTFEIIVVNVDIAQNEQFLHLPQLFQLYSIMILSFIEIYFGLDHSKFFCCRFIIWERVNTLPNGPRSGQRNYVSIHHTMKYIHKYCDQTFNNSYKLPLKNH